MNFSIDIFSKYKVKTIRKWSTRVAFDEFEKDGFTRINIKDGGCLIDYISQCIGNTYNIIAVNYHINENNTFIIRIEGFNANTGESDDTTLIINRKEDE